MPRNFTRSRSGVRVRSASCSTRSSKAIHDSSRLNRSSGASSGISSGSLASCGGAGRSSPTTSARAACAAASRATSCGFDGFSPRACCSGASSMGSAVCSWVPSLTLPTYRCAPGLTTGRPRSSRVVHHRPGAWARAGVLGPAHRPRATARRPAREAPRLARGSSQQGREGRRHRALDPHRDVARGPERQSSSSIRTRQRRAGGRRAGATHAVRPPAESRPSPVPSASARSRCSRRRRRARPRSSNARYAMSALPFAVGADAPRLLAEPRADHGASVAVGETRRAR